MSRRVLITGGSGFVGQWLSKAMLERGWTVFAGTIDQSPSRNVLTDRERSAIQTVQLDVTSDASIAAAIAASRPDYVAHLAGIAFAPEANASPIRTMEINALGAMRLLNALASGTNNELRVLIVGSAEQYGAQDASSYPIAETATLRPLTPYAVSKATQELIALQTGRSTGLGVICTRSFNHSGVGHSDDYLLPVLVRRAGDLPPTGGTLQIGNGDVVRDYLHVRDVADAYVLLLERGIPGEVYNVCSGRGTTVRELAGLVLKRAAITADITSDSTLLRAIDVPILVGDNEKLSRTTGWAPARSVEDIIDDLIHAATR